MIKTNNILILIIFVLSLFNHSLIRAQSVEKYSNLRYKSYSIQQGLSQSSVLCMLQDLQGFIWMGTKDGLNRFDGYSFLHFKNEPTNPASISNNEIIALEMNALGELFIGTRDGLNKYIPEKGSFIRYSQLSIHDNTISSIHCEPDGSMWIGTSDGLFLCNPNGKEDHQFSFVNVSALSTYYDPANSILPYTRNMFSVVSIETYDEKSLLIGTERGLYLFDKEKKKFEQIDIGDNNYSKVNSIVWDSKRKDIIWTGSSEGITKIKISNGRPSSYITFNHTHPDWQNIRINWINAVSSDDTGNLWAGTRGGGLIMIDQEDRITQFYSDFNQSNRIGDNLINSLLIDRTKVLWMGTESRGGVTLDLFRKKFNHLENHTPTGLSLTNNLVTAIAGSRNTIWVGTAFNGLDKLDFKPDNTVQTTHFSRIPIGSGRTSNEIISLLHDKSNTLWIGVASNNVVTYHEKTGFKQIFVGGFVFALWQDREDDIWLGTWGQGVGLYQPLSNSIQTFNNTGTSPHALSSDKVLSLFDDKEGILWIGTKGGGLSLIPLHMIKQGYQSFATYRHNPEKEYSLSHNDVLCIMQDSKNNYWIGTGNGLNRVVVSHEGNLKENLLQGNVQFKVYTENDGLPGNVIYSVMEDQFGKLWISTINGISEFDPQKETFKKYGVNDGVQSNELHSNAYHQSNNMLFFGGEKGLTFFNPADITINPHPSNLVISGLKVMNQAVTPNKKIHGNIILKDDISKTSRITLTPKHKEFTIEFSALHFANPEGVHYAYRLKGFNDEWRYTSGRERSATYTNLWEGEYVFQVKSANNDGIWNETPQEIIIKVKPPYWRNPWFYSVYVAIIALGLLLFRRYSLIAVSEKNRLMIERIERKNLIENTEAKMRFFTNISHEIRTPLTLISNPLDEVINKSEIDEQSKNKLKLAAKNVARLLNLTNQLLQLRRIDKGGIEPQYSPVTVCSFVKDVIGFFEQKALNKSIELTYTCDVPAEEKLWIDAEMLTTSIYNVLSNAFKFTPEHGKVSVQVFYYDKPEHLSPIRLQKRHGSNMAIKISDTGIGIAKPDLDRIFIRFFQGKGGSKNESAGSGIGLSLVKEYIELHQGHVEVESTPGKGTTITIILPLGRAHIKTKSMSNASDTHRVSLPVEEDQWNTDSLTATDNEQIAASGNLPKVLIVEDDAELLRYLAEQFGAFYRVAVCSNGKSGLIKAREWEPNLIISDVMMPEMTGIELCNAIKSDIETSHIPVILLTAKAADENAIEGYESGADLYVTKPFMIEVLETQVKQLLQNRKQLQEKFSKQILLKPRDITITSIDEQFIEKMNAIIEENLAETDFDVTEMVKRMNMSHSTVLKKVKALTGMPMVEFVKNQRLKRAAQILVQDKLQIAEVAYMVGFSDPKYFSKCFSKAFGMTPSEYIVAHKGN